jgi:HEAT repeat protein
LSLLGDEAAVSILLNATRLPDENVRLPAAEALGRVRSNRAVAVLTEALGDRDWLVRQKAVEALGAIADGRAVTALLLLTDEPEWRVRRALVTALARVGDSRALPSLRALVVDSNRWVRRAVMEIGAQFDDAGVIELLVTGLADGDPSVRQAALVSLGRRREPSVAADVAGALLDADTQVRLAAVRAISLVDPTQAVTHLAALAGAEPDAAVRQAIADALGELGLPESVAPLTVLLADSDQAVQAQAAEALALVGTQPALEALAGGLCYPAVKHQILAELARLGVPAFRVLLTCARAGQPELRAASAEALGLMRNTLALPTLRLLARDPDERVRAVAGQALAAISAAPPP